MTDALDLDVLEALAKAATPGPWEKRHGSDWAPCDYIRGRGGVTVACDFDRYQDTSYIAATSPDVVLALIARVRELEVTVAKLHAERSVVP